MKKQSPEAFNTGIAIKSLPRRLPEIGKIKIGKKGEVKTSKQGNKFRLPQKLDYFLITKLEESDDGNFEIDVDTTEIVKEYLKTKYGDAAAKKITRIPIVLPFDTPELNCMTRISRYTGTKLTGVSDGETYWKVDPSTQKRTEIDTPTPEQLENEWKWNGTMAVVIQGARRVGGVWKFRTTGYNSIVDLLSSMDLIALHTGGRLAGVPLEMVVKPRRAVDPRGQAQTVYSVSLEFPGTQAELASAVTHLLENQYRNDANIKRLENAAVRLMSADDFDDEAGVTDEFYPDKDLVDEVKNEKPEGIEAINDLVKDTDKPTPPKKEKKPDPEPLPDHVDAEFEETDDHEEDEDDDLI